MSGLHLFHSGPSSCSQRVRLALAEKELAWVSHLVDLGVGEQLRPGYLAINPYGLVPA
ncbi:MAG: glutathione S-transferase family protein, partial [Brevundimonas sp.]